MTFESRITSQKYLNGIKVLNTEQRGRVLWQASINEGKDPNAQPLYDYEWSTDNNGNPVLQKVIPITWINEDMGIKAADTDWYKEVTLFDFDQSVNLINKWKIRRRKIVCNAL